VPVCCRGAIAFFGITQFGTARKKQLLPLETSAVAAVVYHREDMVVGSPENWFYEALLTFTNDYYRVLTLTKNASLQLTGRDEPGCFEAVNVI